MGGFPRICTRLASLTLKWVELLSMIYFEQVPACPGAHLQKSTPSIPSINYVTSDCDLSLDQKKSCALTRQRKNPRSLEKGHPRFSLVRSSAPDHIGSITWTQAITTYQTPSNDTDKWTKQSHLWKHSTSKGRTLTTASLLRRTEKISPRQIATPKRGITSAGREHLAIRFRVYVDKHA